MRRARHAAAAPALVLALVAPACGGHSLEVSRPDVVERRDVERYPPGDPARALLELTRLMQSNDPFAVTERVTPKWRLSPGKVADAVPELGILTQPFGVPEIVRVRRGARTATIDASWGPWRARVTLHAARRTWLVGRVLLNGRRAQFGDVRSP